MQVVLDTNVVISAFLTANGNPSKILRMILEKKLSFVYNITILTEYEGVMSRAKFAKKINQEQIKSFIEAILITGNTKHYPKENFILTPKEFLDSVGV